MINIFSVFVDVLPGSVFSEDDHGSFRPVFQRQTVFTCKLQDFFAVRHILVCPETHGKIFLPGIGGEKVTTGEHRDIEHGKACPGYQESHDEHVVDCLPSLEFHHAARDDLSVRVLFASLSADDEKEDEQIDAGKDRKIKQITPCRSEYAEDGFEKPGVSVACCCPEYDKKDACRKIPGLYIPDRLTLSLLIYHIQDVGAGKKTHGKEKTEKQRGAEKSCADDQAERSERKYGAFLIREKKPEDLPDPQGEQRTQYDAGQSGNRHGGEQFTEELSCKGALSGAQRHEDSDLPGFIPEEEKGGVNCENQTAKDGNAEDHHDLFHAVASGRKGLLYCGRPDQEGKRADQKVRDEVAQDQKTVICLCMSAEFGKDLFHCTD